MRSAIYLFLTCGIVFTPAPALWAQPDVTEAQVTRAAARYIATLYTTERVAYDTVDQGGRPRRAGLLRHGGLSDSTLATELHTGRIGQRADFIRCPTGALSCAFHDVDVVISLNTPVIRGDSAFILVTTDRPARHPPVYRRTEALTFVRRDRIWVFDHSRTVAQS
jgi:hypothetical protein